MKYKKFNIYNYKGIVETSIDIPLDGGGGIILMGLNESGKTTILEALYSFSPDQESRAVLGDTVISSEPSGKIPRSKMFSFNDSIKIEAKLVYSEGEKDTILKKILKDIGLTVDKDSLSDDLTIINVANYNNSIFTKSVVNWYIGDLKVKSGSQKKFRSISDGDWRKVVAIVRNYIPSIAYFPTFLSEVPRRVYLREDGDKVNGFYRRVFEDILHQMGDGYSIKSQITDRIDEYYKENVNFVASFWGSDRKRMVQQLIDRASSVLSKVITDRWNDIFKAQTSGREVVIEFGVDEPDVGEYANPYIEFSIKDGANRFNISDRSLGFRWFFCFLLFTQFRAKRKNSVGTLFLFDEPASNLHAKAQEKLLDSFKNLTEMPNRLIYSTHSPYMINPMWLDNAYVIENSFVESDIDSIGSMVVTDESNISAVKYKKFVDRYPDRLNHFQPVLDRLEVKPSVSEISERTLVVEGKSDYVILTCLLSGQNLPFKIIPAHGATTLSGVVALLHGWGWSFSVLLDSDAEGLSAAEKLKGDLNIVNRVINFHEIFEMNEEVEDILSSRDKSIVEKDLGLSSKPTKKDIYRFFLKNADGISKFKLDAMKQVNRKLLVDRVNQGIKNAV